MARLPSIDDIRAWLRDNPAKSSKRDIARAFGIKGTDKVDLKRLLRELEEDGTLQRRRKTYREPGALPPVTVLEVMAPDKNGDLFATPANWQEDSPAPRALIIAKKGDPALGRSDRILARLTPVEAEDHAYEARLIRRIGAGPQRLLGIYRKTAEGGRIMPIDKGADREWIVPAPDRGEAHDGDLVEAQQTAPKSRLGLPVARVVQVLGDPGAPKAISLIAIHAHGIPDAFPDDVLAEADQQVEAGLGSRTDLRDLPFVTIDPVDARDRDDAVLAMPDPDKGNPGGHIIWVAIADVAHYVTPGSALDREAKTRGNSTYFPDRVVPMLPDRLSGDLCSLHEEVERTVLAVSMTIDAQGNKLRHHFVRGLIRSNASLDYARVQAAIDGRPDDQCAPLLDTVLRPLFDAWKSLRMGRDARQPLDLDLPERQIVLSDEGKVTSVAFKDRLDAHKVIEDCMILANVCAAETLEEKRTPLLYRVHEEPSPDKLDALRETAVACGLTLAKGQVLKTRHLNTLLHGAAQGEFAELINMTVLRSMTQAYYSRENLGHFGLALRRYAHFTSPIRRYADLVVHRALIRAHGWGKDGLTDAGIEALAETAVQISQTERRSMVAERDTSDRYLAAYLSDRVGNEFAGRISGIARFGLFARLDETGADGLIPLSTLGREYFRYDEDENTLTGEHSGLVIGLGMRVTVRLEEAVAITGGLRFELLDLDGKPLPKGGRGRGKRPSPRGAGKGGKARKKLQKAEKRRRR